MFKLLVSLLLITNFGSSIKVCKNFIDYYKIYSRNCVSNPNDKLNVTEIIKKWNFNVEEHTVTTEDGYVLLLVRVYNEVTKEYPVFLAHGFLANSVLSTLLDEDSMVYWFASQGYDVWLINFRGTLYSSHVDLTKNDNRFWNYSFHEMGIFDIRSTSDYILKNTTKKSIFIGYVSSASAVYIYSSLYPTEAQERFKGIISMAPTFTLEDTQSLVYLVYLFWPVAERIFNNLFQGMCPLMYAVPFLRFLARYPSGMFLFSVLLGTLIGVDLEQINPVTYPVVMVKFSDNFAAKIATHYFQNKEANEFRYFDYFTEKNLEIYGSIEPPEYPLSDVTVPTSFILGRNDPVATDKETQRIYNKFNSSIQCGYRFVPNKIWTHLDYFAAKNINLLYGVLKEEVAKMESGEC